MTGHQPAAHWQLRLSLAVGLAMSAAFGVWVWAQEPPPARGPVGLPPRTGTEARAKGLGLGLSAAKLRSRPAGSRLVNVVDFRADPTGATDSTAAIEAACDSLLDTRGLNGGHNGAGSGIVWLRGGRYTTSRPIWIDGDGISIRGEDRRTTMLYGSFIMGHRRRTEWNRNLRSNEPIPQGQVTFTYGSKTVTGVGTQFTRHFTPFLKYPLFIKSASSDAWYAVASVQSNTQLTLAVPFAQATIAGTGYNRGVDYLRRIPAVFAADHRIDAYRKLDGSLAPSTGARWGITDKSPTSGSPFPDHWVVFPFAAPSTGYHYMDQYGNHIYDCWESTQALTLEFLIEGLKGSSDPDVPIDIMGMGHNGSPQPWWLRYVNGYEFTFYTKEGTRGQNGNAARRFKFGSGSDLSRLQAVCIQIDFLHNTDGSTDASAPCSIRAWINGVEQTISRTSNAYGVNLLTESPGVEPSFTAADNLHFATSNPGNNINGMFCIWNPISSVLDWNDSQRPSTRPSFTLYGLRFGNAPRYTTTARAQARIDAGTLNDAYRYDARDANLICLLDTTIPPTADYPGRFVNMVGSAGAAYGKQSGLFLPSVQNENLGGFVVNNTISDMHLNGTILVGTCLNPTIERLNMVGNNAWVGIGGDSPSVYDLELRDCVIGDYGLWICGGGWIANIHDIGLATSTRSAIHIDGGSYRIKDIHISDSGLSESYIKITGNLDYGTGYDIDTVYSDNESNALPSVAFIYAERGPLNQTPLFVRNLVPAQTPPYTPTIKLVDRQPLPGPSHPGPGYLHFTDSLGGIGINVETDGPGWYGVVENMVPDLNFTSIPRSHTGADGQTNVIAKLILPTLPTAGAWYKNSTEIKITQPTGGGSDSYRCSQSGFGTWNSAQAYSGPGKPGTGYGATIVYKSGVVYYCLVKNTNDPPPSANWSTIPAWNSGKMYARWSFVTFGGFVWINTIGCTNCKPGTSQVPPGLPYVPTTGTIWRQMGVVGQALWAPLNQLGANTPGP